MKRTALIIKCAFAGTLGIILYYTSMSFHTHATHVASCSFVFDPLLSEKTHQLICSTFKEASHTTIHDYKITLKTLSTKIPVIASTFITLTPQANALITLLSKKPLFSVNTITIISDDGIPLNADFFNTRTRTSLPNITVSDNPDYKKLFQWFIHNNQTLARLYTIHWKNEDAIFVYDKKNPKNILISTAQQTLQKKEHLLCHNLITQHQKKNLNKKKLWIADMRFTNQIIIYQENKEEFYGSLFI